MEKVKNKSAIDRIIESFFMSKKYDYNQFIMCKTFSYLDNFLEMFNFQHSTHKIQNKNKQKLYASLFVKRHLSQKPQVCILYLHGYGSNRLQCLNILKVLNQQIALSCFDFSGSGKSQGNIVTYGAKQKQDIGYVLSYLKQKGFKKFILWGRSMGATSSLLFTLKHRPNQVILQIIDSPFYSFQQVAKQLIQKQLKIPNFGINLLVDLVKDYCKPMKDNPFSVQLSEIGKCQTPAIFIYCQNDDIISFKNCQKICSLYKAKFQKYLIQENHNAVRSVDTLQKIMKAIQKYVKQSNKQQKAKSIQKNNSSKSLIKKGIQRIHHVISPDSRMTHSDYGIWMSSKSFMNKIKDKNEQQKKKIFKCQTPNIHFSFVNKQIQCQAQNKHSVIKNDDYNLKTFTKQKEIHHKKNNFLYRSMDNKSFSSAKTNSTIRSSMMLSFKHYL